MMTMLVQNREYNLRFKSVISWSDLKTRRGDNFVNNVRFIKSVVRKTDLKCLFVFCQHFLNRLHK